MTSTIEWIRGNKWKNSVNNKMPGPIWTMPHNFRPFIFQPPLTKSLTSGELCNNSARGTQLSAFTNRNCYCWKQQLNTREKIDSASTNPTADAVCQINAHEIVRQPHLDNNSGTISQDAWDQSQTHSAAGAAWSRLST